MSNEELAVAIQAGDTSLLKLLWEQCYGFIRQQATRFIRVYDGQCSFDVDDLIQESYFGLCEACKTFRPEKSSFCHWLTLYLKTVFACVAGFRTAAQRGEPLNRAGSLDEPVKSGEGGRGTLKGDFIEDQSWDIAAVEDGVFQVQCAKILRSKVAQLQEKQRTAVEMKYWENATDQAIADKLHCSRSYANVSVKNGLKTLRKQDVDHTLRNLLDDMYYEERNLYRGVGFTSFKRTGFSSPEYEVCRKEERQYRKNRSEREKQIALLMKCFKIDRATAEAWITQKPA